MNPIIRRRLARALLRKPADAKMAARKREPATRPRALGALGAPALSRTPASARTRKRRPAKLVTLAARKRARQPATLPRVNGITVLGALAVKHSTSATAKIRPPEKPLRRPARTDTRARKRELGTPRPALGVIGLTPARIPAKKTILCQLEPEY